MVAVLAFAGRVDARPGKMVCKVTLQQGEHNVPLKNAVVKVVGFPLKGHTDEAGLVTLDSIEVGADYMVVASIEGYKAAIDRHVEVHSGQITCLEFVIREPEVLTPGPALGVAAN